VLRKGTINPMQVYCSDGRFLVFRNTMWPSQQYRSIPGKYIGVSEMGHTSNYLVDKQQYGIVGAEELQPLVGSLLSYGYSPDNILVAIQEERDWQTDVVLAIQQGVHHFCIDEPITNHKEALTKNAATFVAQHGGTLVIWDGYYNWFYWYYLGMRGTMSDLVLLALQCTPPPFVGCDTHFEHAGCGIDPRDQWHYLRDQLGSYFNLIWINTYLDTYSEINLLFYEANNMGINQMYLYVYNGSAYVGPQTAVGCGHNYQWNQELFQEVRQQWCCPSIYWDPEECYFKSQSYTGYSEWD
jgi:hypothetical protein